MLDVSSAFVKRSMAPQSSSSTAWIARYTAIALHSTNGRGRAACTCTASIATLHALTAVVERDNAHADISQYRIDGGHVHLVKSAHLQPEGWAKMGMHTVAFSSSIANGSTYLALSAISDTIMAPSGSGLLLPCDLRMIAGFASGVTLQRARVNAPSLLRVGYPSIRPLRSSAATPDSDPNFMSLLGNPVLLRSSEALGVDAVHGLGTPEREFALLWLADRLEPVPAGDSFSLRFTASVTTTANAWTVLSPTYDQSIPSGTYAVIGMEAIGTNALAARLVFPGAVFRPGVVASTSTASRTHASFYDGSFGTYGVFQTNSPPNIEWLSALTADTAEEGYLRVVRIGDVGASPMLPGGPMLPPSASPVMGAGGGVAGVSGGGVSAGGALSTSAGLYGTKR